MPPGNAGITSNAVGTTSTFGSTGTSRFPGVVVTVPVVVVPVAPMSVPSGPGLGAAGGSIFDLISFASAALVTVTLLVRSVCLVTSVNGAVFFCVGGSGGSSCAIGTTFENSIILSKGLISSVGKVHKELSNRPTTEMEAIKNNPKKKAISVVFGLS